LPTSPTNVCSPWESVAPKKLPDRLHPYGYDRERYIWALISAVGIFFLGCGVTVYHGISTLIHPHPIEDFKIAFIILAFALVVEGFTLLLAWRAVDEEARRAKQTFFKYLNKGTDPTGVAVVLEDAAAILGVLIAAAGLGLTYATGNTVWDSAATITIGLLLGMVALFLTHRTKALLIGQSIPEVSRKKILQILQADPVVENIYDIKTAIMGVDDLRFKAEIEFNGEAIADKYLKKTNLDKTFGKLDSHEKVRAFLVKYGDHVVEALGDEIDRIEQKLKAEIPELKHIDIEVN